MTLHAWSRQGGTREAHLIAGALLQALDDAPLPLTDHALVNLRFSLADIRREADGRTYHALVRFRAVTEPTLTQKDRTMTAQKGKDLLVKISDGAGGFTTVAGLRTRRLAFNAETVDVTNAESANRWRELLDGAGVKRASVTGRGLFKDAATDGLMRQTFFDGTVVDYQIVIPDFGTVQGAVPDHRSGICRRAQWRGHLRHHL